VSAAWSVARLVGMEFKRWPCIRSGNWLIINPHGLNEHKRDKYAVNLANLVLYSSGIKMLELYVITHQSCVI